MKLTSIMKKVFFALILGTFLIYAIGGAAIASATISEHQAIIPGIVNVMVSLGMTWLMVLGIPFLVMASYYFYDSLYAGMTEFSEDLADAWNNRKGKRPTEEANRLSLNEQETQRAHLSDNTDPFKEMAQ